MDQLTRVRQAIANARRGATTSKSAQARGSRFKGDSGLIAVDRVPNRIFRVPAIPALLAGASTLASVRFEVSEPGLIIGWRGCALGTGHVDQMQSIGVRFNLNGQEEYSTSGLSADFAIFANLFPTSARFAPLCLPVDQRDQLNFDFKNFHASQAFTPELELFFAYEKA